MSNILGTAPQSVGNALIDAQEELFSKQQALRSRKEMTTKAVEEGLGGLKVLLGGKGIGEKVLEDPIVQKYGKQLRARAGDAIKKAGQDLLDRVRPLEFSTEEAPAGAGPSISYVNPAFSPQEADAAELASKQNELDSLISKGARRLQEGEDVFREGYEGGVAGTPTGAENLKSGSGSLFRASDRPEAFDDILDEEHENVEDNAGLAKALPEDNLSRGEFGTAETGGMTEAEAGRAGQLSAEIASKSEAPTTTASGANVSTAAGAEIEGATETAGAEAGAGAAAVGGDVAVGAGEAVLGALDAIPILDIFTLAAGAGLAAGAAAKRPKPPEQFKGPIDSLQSGSAFQAGFSTI